MRLPRHRVGPLERRGAPAAQRSLADALGIDFTTVSRAYAEARRRGLVDGRVGQGTFVRAKPPVAANPASGLVDMSMNQPPRFDDPALTARLWAGIASLETTHGLDPRAPLPGAGRNRGRPRRRRALALAKASNRSQAAQVLVCPGAQGALLAVAGLLAAPGEANLRGGDHLSRFPLARRPSAHPPSPGGDGPGGDRPDAFDAVCRQEKPKALYCNADAAKTPPRPPCRWPGAKPWSRSRGTTASRSSRMTPTAPFRCRHRRPWPPLRRS